MDAMCIPTCAKNKEVAEAYINFMLDTDVEIGGEHHDIARANAEYIYYATPNSAVYENPEYQEALGKGDEECDYYEMLYPEGFDFAASYNEFAYANLDPELLAYISDLWLDLKLLN
jgi:spermidine/putrescine-binding protein